MADTITDLLVGLGVKVQPQTIETIKAFDKYVRKATLTVKAWSKQDAGLNKVSASILTMTRAMKGLNAQLEALGKNQTALNALSKVKIVNTGDKGGLVRAGMDSAAREEARAAKSAEIAERRRKQEEARNAASKAREERRAERLAQAQERRDARVAERARMANKRAFEEEIALNNRRRNLEASAQAREDQRRVQATYRSTRENQKAAKREGTAQARNIALLEKHRNKLQSIGASSSAVDKAALAYMRERDAIREAAALTGNHAGAVRALAAAEKKYADALARDAAKSDKMRIKAAKETTSFMDNLSAAKGPLMAVVGLLTAMGTAAVGAAYGIGKLGVALAENSLAVAQDALKIERQAKMFGLSNKAYQTLRHTMGLFGVDQRDISDMFGQYAQMIKAGAEGQKTASEAFKTLGMDAKALLKLSPEEQIYALADATTKVGNATKRTAAISTMLGEDLAKKAGPMLILGSQYMKDMAEQAERLGAIMTDKDIDGARQLTTAWVKLTTIIKGATLSLGNKLIPVLTNLADRLLAWYDVNDEIIAQGIDDFAKTATDAFTELGKAGDYVDRIFGGMDGFFEFVDKLKIAAMIMAGFALAATALGTPLLIPLGFLGAIALVLQDIYIWMTGGVSIFGEWIEKITFFDGLIASLSKLLTAWGQVGRAALAWISFGLNEIALFLKPVTDMFSYLFGYVFGSMAASAEFVLGEMLDTITSIVDRMVELVSTLAKLMGMPPDFKATATTENVTVGDDYSDGQSFDETAFSAPVKSSASMPFSNVFAPKAPSMPAPSASSRQASAGSNVVINIGGPTINGSNLSEAQLRTLFSQYAEENGRQVQQSLIGLPV